MSRAIIPQRLAKSLKELANARNRVLGSRRDVEEGQGDEKAPVDESKREDAQPTKEGAGTDEAKTKYLLWPLKVAGRVVWIAVLLGWLAILGSLWLALYITLFACALAAEVGVHAFIGFLGLTLGHAVLHGARPGDAAYDVSVRSTMQAGAIGGAILGPPCAALTLLAVVAGDSDKDLLMGMGAIVKIALSLAFGAATGPLGVAVLMHYRGPSGMLDVTHAARAGVLGAFLLSVCYILSSRWEVTVKTIKTKKDPLPRCES